MFFDPINIMGIPTKMFRQFAQVESKEETEPEEAEDPPKKKKSPLTVNSPETIAGEGSDVRPELNLELGKKNPVGINSAETIAGESNS